MRYPILKARTFFVAAAAILTGLSATMSLAQAAGASPQTPANQAVYFSHGSLDSVWTDLEAKKILNKRVVEAGKYSINIRTIEETTPPQVHNKSVDIWIMEEGSAVALTGGTLTGPMTPTTNGDSEAGSSISGATEQAFLPGDILYVPPGVAHGFKNVKGFRAILIRIDLQ